jgi:hypothetical protein
VATSVGPQALAPVPLLKVVVPMLLPEHPARLAPQDWSCSCIPPALPIMLPTGG